MTLLRMSLTGGVMAAAVILLRTLTRSRLPQRALLPLWYAVLARLLVPFSLPCPWSVYTLLDRLRPAARTIAPVTAPAVTAPTPVVTATAPTVPAAPAMTAPSAHAADFGPATTLSIDPWLAVWLLGALCCAVFFAMAYLRCRRHFAQSLPLESECARRWLKAHPLRRRLTLRQSDRVGAPLTYGVLRPVILLPRDFDWDETESAKYVLEHEYVHVRHFDALAKLLLTAAVCVHWFNPLTWCMYVLVNRDIELACDEAVLRRFGHEAKSAYAMALIRMAGSGDGPAPLYSGFGKSAVEERITAIMKIKKTSAAALLVAAGLLAGVTTVFATSAAPGSGARPLTEKEIARVNEAFAPIVTEPAEGGGTVGHANEVSCFFTSLYDDPRQLDFQEFLRYFPSDECLTDADTEEFAALSALPDFIFKDSAQTLTPETMLVPVHRIREENINAALEKWAGITLDDIADKSGVCYLPEYGSYYTFTSDFGPGVFNCSGGEVNGDTARLWSEPGALREGCVLTLERRGGRWLIRSHQDAGVLAGTYLSSGAADTVLSYTDADGQTWYSEDNGKTFLSEADFRAAYPETDVEWWTYDEYAAWLENEKVELQSMLGEKGWTGGRGEFVWTQYEIDKAIAWYEEILAEIGRGVKVSKTVDGSEDTMLMENPYDRLLGTNESEPCAADFAEYESFGLAWDEAQKALLYNGERVRYFLDGAELEDGAWATRLEYADRELTGELDLYAVRQRADNGNGSYDPFGPLLRLKKRSQSLFDARISASPELAATAADTFFRQLTAESAEETGKLLERYAPFGLSWRTHPTTGELSMSYDGRAVHSLFDSVEQVWIANNINGTDLEAGALDLEAVYENGRLTGLREVEPATVEQGAGTEGTGEPGTEISAAAEGSGGPGGMTFAELFEKYAAFGISYAEAEGASGAGNVYLNGHLVSRFADERPDGGVFTFESADEGGMAVRAVYDEAGKLTGVTELG